MFIAKYFSGASARAGSPGPATVDAASVHNLDGLKPLRDSKADDGTQVRLSGRIWKVKPQPGARVSRSAQAHIDAAIAGNRSLLAKSLNERGCALAPDALIQRIRGFDQAPLTLGDLRSEQQALGLIDQAKAKGMAPDAAFQLVNKALLHRNMNGGLDLQADVPELAAIMARAPQLSFEEALKVLQGRAAPLLTSDLTRTADADTSVRLHTVTPPRPGQTVRWGQSPSAASPTRSPSATSIFTASVSNASSPSREDPAYHPALEALFKARLDLAKTPPYKLAPLSEVLQQITAKGGSISQVNLASLLGVLKADLTIGKAEADVLAAITRLRMHHRLI